MRISLPKRKTPTETETETEKRDDAIPQASKLKVMQKLKRKLNLSKEEIINFLSSDSLEDEEVIPPTQLQKKAKPAETASRPGDTATDAPPSVSYHVWLPGR